MRKTKIKGKGIITDMFKSKNQIYTVRGMPEVYFKVAQNPLKKYDAFWKGTTKRITAFGSRLHDHYFDVIGYFSKGNHLDKERRRLYYARHGLEAPKYSAKYFSHKILWPLNI